MKKTLFKNFYRTILMSFPKFLSIVFMIGLGVMVFVGLKITPNIMRRSIDKHIDSGNLYDFKVSSNFGLLQEDIEIISKLKDLKDVEYGYSINLKDEDKKIDFTVESKSENISKVNVIDGRDILDKSDILLDERLKSDYKIGDKINFKNVEKFCIFKDEVKRLKYNSFNVVGFIKSPEITTSILRGNTENGYLAIIAKDSFDFTYFSYAKIIFSNLSNIDKNSKDFQKIKSDKNLEMKETFKNRPLEVYDLIYSQKKEILDDKEEEVSKNKFDIEESEKKLEENLNKLEAGKNDIRTAFADLSYQREKFLRDIEKNIQIITENINNLSSEELSLKNKKNELVKKNDTLVKDKDTLKKSESEINSKIKTKEEFLNVLEENFNSKLIDEKEYNEKKFSLQKELFSLYKERSDILKNIKTIEDELSKLVLNIKEIENSQQTIYLEKQNLEKNLKELDTKNKQSILKFDEYYSKLVQKKEEIQENNLKLNKGKNDLEQAKSKILDANNKISDGEEILSKLMEPVYNIDDGFTTSSASNVYFAANGIYGVSNVFSIFFYFIALLVSLTTMTRMVDENRTQIGTLKALGYSNVDIAKQYFYYGLLASVIGGVIGAVLGFKIISPLVYNSYLKAFIFDKIFDKYYLEIVFSGIFIAILCTAFVSYITCIKTLNEKISSLMRAKIPKNGNKVFVEKISYIWKELSFLQKATLRNVFRYKLRLFMTIIGVTGCMSLLVLGFGIKDSINGLYDVQYKNYTKYHISTIYNPMSLSKDLDSFNNDIKSDKDIKDSIDVSMEIVNINSDKNFDEKIVVFVTEDLEHFSKFFGLFNGNDSIKKLNDGIYINRKISEKFSISVGDKISFVNNNKNYEALVAGVFENHVGNFFVMNKKTFENTFFKKNIKNTKLLILNDGSSENIKEVVEKIEKNPVVIKANDINELKKIIDDVSYSVNSIILVIVVCSGFLSIVVLYNLSNINISERKREIATLKVLGFYPIEIDKYIYKETLILTFIGIFVGIFVGHFLHINIMQQLAMNSIRFFNKVKLLSYIYSALITLFFTFVVYLIVKIILKKVPMIESLKDIE